MYYFITLTFDNRGHDMKNNPATGSIPVELQSMTRLLHMLAQCGYTSSGDGVIKAVKNTLDYYDIHKTELYK